MTAAFVVVIVVVLYYVFEYQPKWCTDSAVLVVTWLVPRETAAVSAHVLCTPYNHAPVYSVISFEATYVGCMCV